MFAVKDQFPLLDPSQIFKFIAERSPKSCSPDVVLGTYIVKNFAVYSFIYPGKGENH